MATNPAQPQEIKTEYKEQMPLVPPPMSNVRLESIFGFLPRVSATPTWTPRTFKQAFATYKNGATHRFYYYDFSDNTWRYMSAT